MFGGALTGVVGWWQRWITMMLCYMASRTNRRRHGFARWWQPSRSRNTKSPAVMFFAGQSPTSYQFSTIKSLQLSARSITSPLPFSKKNGVVRRTVRSGSLALQRWPSVGFWMTKRSCNVFTITRHIQPSWKEHYVWLFSFSILSWKKNHIAIPAKIRNNTSMFLGQDIYWRQWMLDQVKPVLKHWFTT